MRLASLLGDTPAGADPIDLTVGGPRHAFPPFVTDVIAREAEGFGRYPPARGTPVFRQAAGRWAAARFNLGDALDPDRHVLPLAGSREGLFTACFIAVARAAERGVDRPCVLMPNPFYQTYAAAALAAGAEPIYLESSGATGDLPDIESIPPGDLDRAAAFILCTPANPQGAVASPAYLNRLVALARQHGFLFFSDECYSEIYRDTPPSGALESGADGGFANVLAFNSLSKRSNLPGLRVGLAAGDPDLINAFHAFRNVVAATVPTPIQAAAAAVWADEAHVEENRRLYNEKYARAESALGERFGPVTPPGGFFVWLDVARYGGGEAVAAALWARTGVKVLPGSYLSAGPEDANPGSAHIRLALVASVSEVETALDRLLSVLE